MKCGINVNLFGVYFLLCKATAFVKFCFQNGCIVFGNNKDTPVQCNIGTSVRIWLDAMDVNSIGSWG